ncbi:MAG: c-type cytochrome, partial [Pirellulaceae bacterium]
FATSPGALLVGLSAFWAGLMSGGVVAQPIVSSVAGIDLSRPLLAEGQRIYAARCRSCHGPHGEGMTEEYADALVGDATVGELTRLIDETMPKDDPSQCVGPEAQAVAAYIHEAFYSEAAQLRLRPPRAGIARLTSQQLRQSLADLYASLDGVT